MIRTKRTLFGLLLTVCLLAGSCAAVYASSSTDRNWTNLGNYDSTVNFANAQGRAVFQFSANAFQGDVLQTSGSNWNGGLVFVEANWSGFGDVKGVHEELSRTGSASVVTRGKAWKSTRVSHHRVKANGYDQEWRNTRS